MLFAIFYGVVLFVLVSALWAEIMQSKIEKINKKGGNIDERL